MGDFTTAGEVESVTAHEVINIIIAKRQVRSYKAIFVHKSYNLKKFIFDENMKKGQAFNKP